MAQWVGGREGGEGNEVQKSLARTHARVENDAASRQTGNLEIQTFWCSLVLPVDHALSCGRKVLS